jgi:16S rRNA (cytidine1402-2'-O)-methyltransferase
LVKKCAEEGLNYTAIPGPSAVIEAVVLSGLPVQRFCFLGFLPKKVNDKKRLVEKYKNFEGVKVVYEAGNRVKESVEIIKEVMGDFVEIRVVREMTKKFEEVLKPEEIHNDKGEAVIIFS